MRKIQLFTLILTAFMIAQLLVIVPATGQENEDCNIYIDTMEYDFGGTAVFSSSTRSQNLTQAEYGLELEKFPMPLRRVNPADEAEIEFKFSLTNTGNQEDTYTVEVQTPLTTGTYRNWIMEFQDKNGERRNSINVPKDISTDLTLSVGSRVDITLIVVVDPKEEEGEYTEIAVSASSDNDNVQIRTLNFTLIVILPNIRVSNDPADFWIHPNRNIREGDDVDITVRIYNDGTAETGKFFVFFYNSRRESPTNREGNYVAVETVDNIPANSYYDVLTVWYDIPGGRNDIYVHADKPIETGVYRTVISYKFSADGLVLESRENDNWATIDEQFRNAIDLRPDLTITNIVFHDRERDKTTNVIVTVANLGSAKAEANSAFVNLRIGGTTLREKTSNQINPFIPMDLDINDDIEIEFTWEIPDEKKNFTVMVTVDHPHDSDPTNDRWNYWVHTEDKSGGIAGGGDVMVYGLVVVLAFLVVFILFLLGFGGIRKDIKPQPAGNAIQDRVSTDSSNSHFPPNYAPLAFQSPGQIGRSMSFGRLIGYGIAFYAIIGFAIGIGIFIGIMVSGDEVEDFGALLLAIFSIIIFFGSGPLLGGLIGMFQGAVSREKPFHAAGAGLITGPVGFIIASIIIFLLMVVAVSLKYPSETDDSPDEGEEEIDEFQDAGIFFKMVAQILIPISICCGLGAFITVKGLSNRGLQSSTMIYQGGVIPFGARESPGGPIGPPIQQNHPYPAGYSKMSKDQLTQECQKRRIQVNWWTTDRKALIRKLVEDDQRRQLAHSQGSPLPFPTYKPPETFEITSAPAPSPPTSDLPLGGWSCPKCQTHLEANNIFCFKCGFRRTGKAGQSVMESGEMDEKLDPPAIPEEPPVGTEDRNIPEDQEQPSDEEIASPVDPPPDYRTPSPEDDTPTPESFETPTEPTPEHTGEGEQSSPDDGPPPSSTAPAGGSFSTPDLPPSPGVTPPSVAPQDLPVTTATPDHSVSSVPQSCPRCGKEVTEEEVSCPECGYRKDR